MTRKAPLAEPAVILSNIFKVAFSVCILVHNIHAHARPIKGEQEDNNSIDVDILFVFVLCSGWVQTWPSLLLCPSNPVYPAYLSPSPGEEGPLVHTTPTSLPVLEKKVL